MTTFVCDSCGKSVEGNDPVLRVWTVVTLWVQTGMARVSKSFDLCPSCQDILHDEIKLGGPE